MRKLFKLLSLILLVVLINCALVGCGTLNNVSSELENENAQKIFKNLLILINNLVKYFCKKSRFKIYYLVFWDNIYIDDLLALRNKVRLFLRKRLYAEFIL